MFPTERPLRGTAATRAPILQPRQAGLNRYGSASCCRAEIRRYLYRGSRPVPERDFWMTWRRFESGRHTLQSCHEQVYRNGRFPSP
jgi:hypothetical protein